MLLVVSGPLPGAGFLEPEAKCLAGGAQQTKVAAHRHEGRTPVEIAAGIDLDAGQDAGSFSGGAGPCENVPYSVLHVVMVRIAEMAKGCGDVVDCLKALAGLDLQQHGDVVVDVGEIALHGPVHVAAVSNRNAANALG